MSDTKDNKQLTLDINLDSTPILYTDNVIMSTNKHGVVLDIAQKLGPTKKLRIVSRLGMSREHAKAFITELSKLIAMTEGSSQTGKTKEN